MNELYRDDVQETAIFADAAFLVFGIVAEDVVRAGDDIRSGIGLAVAETAMADDGSADNAAVMVRDVLLVGDGVQVDVGAVAVAHERLRSVDTLNWTQVLLTHEQAQIGDEVLDGGSSSAMEHGRLLDKGLSAVSFALLATDSAKLRGRGLWVSSDAHDDSALVADLGMMATQVRGVGNEVVAFADTAMAIIGVQAQAQEWAKAADWVATWVQAGNMAHDVQVLQDAQVLDEFDSLAWTASVDSWGMSRYLSLPLQGVAVVNGVLHGWSRDGVFVLDGTNENITAWVTTGKVDVGSGILAHPVAAYLEYELADDGVAELAVSSTQSGQKQEFVYSLAAERSNELTNGRFVLGRGLRGRHFGFELRLMGKQAHINDWSLDVVPTKRRV